MKKEEISEILLDLWRGVDQAEFHDMVKEAFINCPVKIQKHFIKEIIRNEDLWIDIDQETIEKANRINV